MKSTSPARVSSDLPYFHLLAAACGNPSRALSACLFLLAAAAGSAQEAGLASLRLVNATGAEGPVHVRLNGEALQTQGYPSSAVTGRLELAAGSCHIELTHPQLGSTSLALELQPGETRTVIALTEPLPLRGERAQPPKLTSHVLAPLPPENSMRHRLQVLQATPLPELVLHLAGRDLRCHRLQAEHLVLEKPNPALEHAGHPLGHLPFEETGDGTLILFTDKAGRLCRVFFLDPDSELEWVDRQ